MSKVWSKIYIDSDATPSTKIAINILNQEAANSCLKHVPFIHAACPDTEDYIGKLFHCVNAFLDDPQAYTVCGYKIRYFVCADTKCEWQVSHVATVCVI